MPPKRSFDAALEKLRELRAAAPEAAGPELARALKLTNNYLVAKAAELALYHDLRALTPDLVAAFPRFLVDAGNRPAVLGQERDQQSPGCV